MYLSSLVSSIGRIEPRVNDREKYERDAMLEAIKNAKEQAAFLVEEFGGNLGRIKSIGNRKIKSEYYYNDEVVVVTGIRASINKHAHFYFNPAPVEIKAEIYAEFGIE